MATTKKCIRYDNKIYKTKSQETTNIFQEGKHKGKIEHSTSMDKWVKSSLTMGAHSTWINNENFNR